MKKIFFSYGTVAQMGEPAYTAAKAFLEEFYTVGPPDVLLKYDPVIDDLADEAARLLNCRPNEITYLKNTTEGICITSEALPLSAGDEIIVQGNEYPSNLLPWLKKRQDGLTVTVIPGHDSPKAFQALLDAIGPHTKAISISSAQYYDGYMADIDLLSGICREKSIFLVLDAVQTVGIRELDLAKTRVDFLICGGQKFLQAGLGNGFLYVNQEIMSQLRDVKVGLRSMQSFTEDGYIIKPTAGRFQDGTPNLPGIVALHAALKHINTIGIQTIEQANLKLLAQIKDCLKSHDIKFIDHGARQSNLVSLQVDDPQSLVDYLAERSVIIRKIKDIARLSFTHESQIEQVEILAKLTHEWAGSRPRRG